MRRVFRLRAAAVARFPYFAGNARGDGRMRHKMILGDPVLVHAAPVDEATSRWGVYCIPKLWRRMDGTLVVRLNGAEDTGRLLEAAPNLYFLSEDEGKTWRFVPDGEREFAEDIPFFSNINPLFTRLRNGDTVGFRRLCRIHGTDAAEDQILSEIKRYKGEEDNGKILTCT